MHELIHDFALPIVMAWLFGVVAHLLRQPLILAYLVAGFVLGPTGLAWVKSEQSIHTISELGLIFMLFMIGLEIDLKKIVRAGRGDPGDLRDADFRLVRARAGAVHVDWVAAQRRPL